MAPRAAPQLRRSMRWHGSTCGMVACGMEARQAECSVTARGSRGTPLGGFDIAGDPNLGAGWKIPSLRRI